MSRIDFAGGAPGPGLGIGVSCGTASASRTLRTALLSSNEAPRGDSKALFCGIRTFYERSLNAVF